MTAAVTVVIPTLGRPSLTALLERLAGVPFDILLVDDRGPVAGELPVPAEVDVKVLPGRAAGPAAARNIGWLAARTEWVVFLDDDVLPDTDWPRRLLDDLAAATIRVGGVQGRLRVPLPADRRPTDWERVTAGLADGEWITADMAYRREALAATGGFDERFPRAFREDAEFAFRVRAAGYDLVRGNRVVTHPVRAESRWVSVRTQRGNADDALLRHLYGRDYRTLLGLPPGRRSRHVAITAAGLAALLLPGRWRAPAGLAWAAGVAEFAAARVRPGPRTRDEVVTMVLTSAVIPPVATAHWLRGLVRHRGARPLESRR